MVGAHNSGLLNLWAMYISTFMCLSPRFSLPVNCPYTYKVLMSELLRREGTEFSVGVVSRAHVQFVFFFGVNPELNQLIV